MKTRAFREYDAANSRKTTHQIRQDMVLIQSCGSNARNRRRKHNMSDIACRLASIALYAGCAVSLCLLIKTIITKQP